MAKTARIDVVVEPRQREALEWYAEQAEVAISEAIRYFLPSRIPDLKGDLDDPADVKATVEALQGFAEVERERYSEQMRRPRRSKASVR